MRTAKYSLEGKPQQSLRSRKTSLTHQMEINFTLPIYPTTTITCRSPTPEFPNINSMYGATENRNMKTTYLSCGCLQDNTLALPLRIQIDVSTILLSFVF
ncbi:hypothetical protein KC19_5G000500 [Ceratodon purpureus]|uniref:Uncharacterized protein n=1 Tax=Ceratodon purpureus TaxID=3225 RepID=A0A8T0HXC6_CERPU|nr:hypothetical protein KC19_9G058400 [Ceratodon purpureus]KAG0575379.1 hypothetical protein KC19_5G000500 [Ceratodon purpureus]